MCGLRSCQSNGSAGISAFGQHSELHGERHMLLERRAYMRHHESGGQGTLGGGGATGKGNSRCGDIDVQDAWTTDAALLRAGILKVSGKL